MTTLDKQQLEQMLKDLDLSKLEDLDSKHRQDNYLYGHRPLLKYAPEALTEYAGAIYRYILPHFGTMSMTEEQYIAQWLAPYTSLQAQLAAKAEDFISRLEDIVANPEPPKDPYPKLIPDLRLYTDTADFSDGADGDLYMDLNDFLTSKASPLRGDSVEDTRALALVAEIDAMCDAGNIALDAFIGQRFDYTWKTEKITGPKGTEKVRYKVAEPSTTYGTELKHLRKLVQERLDYYNLKPADIDLIIAHKDHLPQAEWVIVEQALTANTFTTKAEKAITKLKKHIKDANKLGIKLPKLREISKSKCLLSDEDYATVNQLLHNTADWNLDADRILAQYDDNSKSCMASADYIALCIKIEIAGHLIAHYCDPSQPECAALAPYVSLVHQKDPKSAKQLLQSQAEIHAVTANIHNLFISSFASRVENEYSKLEPISVFALLDAEKKAFTTKNALGEEVSADCYPEQTEAKRQAAITLLAREGYSLDWFDDYTNILSPLSACLNITLNDLTPAPEALTHGAVVGMLEWCEQVKAQLIAVTEGKALDVDYKALAQDLRGKMQYHTLVCNSADYIVVTDTGLTVIEGKSAEYIQDRTSSLSEPTGLIIHNAKYGIVKVCQQVPLPEVYPTGAEPNLPTTQYTDSTFNKTREISIKMSGLQPDTMFSTFTEVSLSEDQVKVLKPVPDHTLTELLTLLSGKACDAYMLRGDLVAHTATGEYLKLIPKMSDDGYMTYIFTAVNWKTLDMLINSYSALLRDTDFYEDIASTLTARKSYECFGDTRAERLQDRYRRYCQDTKLFYELKKLAEDIYKDTDKEALVYSLPKKFVNEYLISQAYLVKWVYNPKEYAQKLGQVQVDAQGEIIENQIHHNDKNPRNNDPDNLPIYDKDSHDDLKSNCIPVMYNGHKYPSISDYVEATSAGAYTKLQQTIKQLQPGDTISYKDRDYSIDPSTGGYIATDIIPQVDFNGAAYTTPQDFAKAKKLSPAALCKKLYREKEKGTEAFYYKGYRFRLLEDNTIKITC